MKAAWKVIEKKFPWITCTCCGTHVINLELKDMGKIPEVESVILKCQKILNRFWGRKRWARKRLREIVLKNHGKKLGLYRAKETRFAGKAKEMARILRLKAELQEIVVSNAYAAQKFTQASGVEFEDDLGTGADDVKVIVLDEAGFWQPVVDALRILTPLVVLLRLFDGEKPVLGKVYDKMFLVGERIQKSTLPWKKRAAEIHAERWEYLHSEMHAAAYALDPEFLDTCGDHDSATQSGLLDVTEKVCLRDEIAAQPDVESAMKTITVDSPEVQARVEKVQSQLMSYQAREGILSKKSVQNLARTKPPAEWWNTYGKNLPDLCSVAKRVLAQPGAASAAERNWSVYGNIKSKGRSQLSHFSADKRVFCHESLRLQEKLQDAKFRQAVQDWEDSDTDSNVSDLDADISGLAR